MLIVKVELHNANTGEISEIARAVIYNDGTGTSEKGNYGARTWRGRTQEDLDKRKVQRVGAVHGYPRLKLHVWNLVTEALGSMGYGRGRKPAAASEDDMDDKPKVNRVKASSDQPQG